MITFTSYSVKEQDPPVYYSIVILTILYYLRVADLMEHSRKCRETRAH